MGQYFPKSYEHSSGKTKIELDLSNQTTKADLKGAAGVNAYTLAGKSYLISLKAEVVKIDIDKVKTVPADLNKLIKVVDNDFVKKLYMKKQSTLEPLITKLRSLRLKVKYFVLLAQLLLLLVMLL